MVFPCPLQDASVHQYHRVRGDKSQELSPKCHGGSAGWYVLVYGLTTVQFSEGFCLCFSWGAGPVLETAVQLAGTGQNFLFLLRTPPAMLSKQLTPACCAPTSDILPGDLRVETLRLVCLGCNTLETSEAICVLRSSCWSCTEWELGLCFVSRRFNG